MMKTIRIYCAGVIMLAMSGTVMGEAVKAVDKGNTPASLVARKDYLLDARWSPKKIMGRDFWNCLPILGGRKTDPSIRALQLRDLNEEPMVKEAAKPYPATGLSGYPYMTDYVAISSLRNLEIKENVPFFLNDLISRPPFNCMMDFKHDLKNYEVWKKAHPNFMGFFGGVEWDNEFMAVMNGKAVETLKSWEKTQARITREEVFRNIRRELPQPKSRQEALAALKKIHQAVRKYYFDDPDKLMFMREFWCLDHQIFEWGADMAWHETTSTGPYRHQVSMFFIRGAARQYDKKWSWYIAMCYNGFDDKGKFESNAQTIYMPEGWITKEQVKPDAGVSVSLIRRDRYLAYLSGASFVESETWPASYCQYKDGNPNLWELAPHGKAMKEWYDFAQRNPGRGASYAPVALLVPFDQGYPECGGQPWSYLKYERPDYMLDAFMQTIVPYSKFSHINDLPAHGGNEGCLYNSPYGDIYDVITPDAPGNPAPVKALQSYKVAILLGKHNLDKALAERLVEYVTNGGTLVINIRQLNGYFSSPFLGFAMGGARDRGLPVKGEIASLVDGKKFGLPEEYEFEKIKLDTAMPVMIDAERNVMACMNKQGKGQVIVSAVDYMVPKKDMSGKGTVEVLNDMAAGRKFPFVEALLSRIVSEVLPLEVKGDIEYGLNKVNGGWWLYLINNKGVTKFTNTKETFDMAKTAKVDVSLKDLKAVKVTELREQKEILLDKGNNSFSAEIAPGDVRVFKIDAN